MGFCEIDKHESDRLYCRVEGKRACVACYNRWRYHNVPGVREMRQKANRKWNDANKDRINAWLRKYRHAKKGKHEEQGPKKRAEG
jgi:hypothetical protein